MKHPLTTPHQPHAMILQYGFGFSWNIFVYYHGLLIDDNESGAHVFNNNISTICHVSSWKLCRSPSVDCVELV